MERGSWLEEEVTGGHALGGCIVLNFFNIFIGFF